MMRLAVALILLMVPVLPALADDRWPAVREISLELKSGSPLDFSTMLPNPAIDESARIAITADGHLARVSEMATPVRFLCASLAWSPASGGFPDHDGADRYARQLRMHGYNIARFHFVDAALMAGRSRDFDFDPEILDRFRYLMAALKRNGIYWIVDGMSSTRGGFGGYDDRWDANGEMKLDTLIDDAAFAHWVRLQHDILATVNPYTHIAPIHDPALVMIVPVNENGIEFDSIAHESAGKPLYNPKLQRPFNAWLCRRYGTSEALSKAWASIEGNQKLEDGTIALPTDKSESSPRMRDLQAFFIDVETKAAKRMEKALRDLGFRGVVAPYNNWATIQTSLTRSSQQAVAMNTYEDWVRSYDPLSRIQGTSSLQDDLSYIRSVAAARWFGKPFIVTEYDHLFWNPYRYEAGLAMPAYAALQRWDVICRHAHGPIVLAYGEDFPHKRRMLPYAIALDPVARAGETLSALLFRRGDVKGSSASIALAVNPADGPSDKIEAREPDGLTRLALLGAIGLTQDNGKDLSGETADVTVPEKRADLSISDILSTLRQKGILDLKTTAVVAVSDTGELVLDRQRLQATIRTERTQAIAFAKLEEPVDLGSVTVKKATGKGLFSVSALDNRPISDSRRLLVIYATDAQNTGMRFADWSERIILDFGKLPVRIRPETIDFLLRGEGNWRLSPVGLDGEVHAAIASGNGTIETSLSNDTPSGPTTYFLIERNP